MEINRISLLEVDSTNNYASNLLKSEKLPHASVITTQFQSHGRGQRNNVWDAAANQNLLATWVFHFSHLPVSESFIYNQTVALALRQAISNWIKHDVFIKWPNDIIVLNKKIAGILIENIIQGDQVKTSLCGIGVNVLQKEFSLPSATSLINLGSTIQEIDQLINNLHHELLHQLQQLQISPKSVQTLYNNHLYQRGNKIEFYYNQKLESGVVSGVDEWGRLVVDHSSIEKRLYQFGEIRWIMP